MNRIEWMAVNPCRDCDLERKADRDHIYGLDNECQCEDQRHYNHELYAQRKLLEYLVGRFWSKDTEVQSIFNEMLLQMNDKLSPIK